jgi:5'-nucleotidase
MTTRLRILLTNDDGYSSPGIRRLHDVLAREHDVTVSAPQSEQSGIGHAFTFNKPLSYNALPVELGMHGWAVGGTPSDCVKFAVSHLLEQKPHIVVSGMNIGENSGISSFYSGTVAAAREGAFWRLPSIAFSVCSNAVLHLAAYCGKAAEILDRIMTIGPANNGKVVFYNVNFPDCAPSACKGIKVTRQSLAFFDDRYKRVTTLGAADGFVVYGDKILVEEHDTFDSRALLNNFITVTPLGFDATAEWALPNLSGLEQSTEQ